MRKFTLLALAVVLGFSFGSAQTTIIQEDFESGTPPTGWTTTQNTPSVGFEFGTNLGSSYFTIPAHTRYAASNDDAHDNSSTTANDASMDYLISPAMDLTPYASSGVVMDFDFIQPGNYGSSGTVEVSTNGGSSWSVVSTVANATTWETATLNLSAYTSSSSVMIGFHHDDGGAWADGFGIDNVHVRSVPANDVAVDEISNDEFVAAGNITIQGVMSNQGYSSLSSVNINYSIDGGTPVTQNLTGLSVALGATSSFSFSTPANLTTPGAYSLKVWTDSPNGMSDAVASNDTMTMTLNVLSSIPVKNALLEDHTGAWCQFCPDGTVVAEQVDANYGSNSIILAVHNNDQMSTTDGDAIANAYISGFPGGTVDHHKFESASDVGISRGSWDSYMSERLGHVVPVSVSFEAVTWNASTRQITASVKADFVGNLSGDIRLNCIIAEDSVVGTGTGYDQVNYYNTQSGHPFFGAGNPIVGFVHDHTARAFLGGSWGQSGIIPASVSDGDSYTHTFTYTLPASYDEGHIKLIALVQNYDSDPFNRSIYNAEEVTLSGAVAIEDVNEVNASMNVYPNPFSNFTNIEFNLEQAGDVSVEIMDMYGKTITTLESGYMNRGMHTVKWGGTFSGSAPAPNGVYFAVLRQGANSVVQKIVLNR